MGKAKSQSVGDASWPGRNLWLYFRITIDDKNRLRISNVGLILISVKEEWGMGIDIQLLLTKGPVKSPDPA